MTWLWMSSSNCKRSSSWKSSSWKSRRSWRRRSSRSRKIIRSRWRNCKISLIRWRVWKSRKLRRIWSQRISFFSHRQKELAESEFDFKFSKPDGNSQVHRPICLYWKTNFMQQLFSFWIILFNTSWDLLVISHMKIDLFSDEPQFWNAASFACWVRHRDHLWQILFTCNLYIIVKLR